MPIVNVKVGAERSGDLTRRIAASVLELTTRILRKKPDVTSIAIEYVQPDDWIVGGRALSEQGKTSFYLEIKITDETNTKDEKAEYVREVFRAFGDLLGSLHEESYVYVHDVRATAYGYGGQTQEHRYQHPV
jgi:4-oxalocrotonate tautomerase